jgi:hypothetical protein
VCSGVNSSGSNGSAELNLEFWLLLFV